MNLSLDTSPANKPAGKLHRFNQLFLERIEPEFQLQTSLYLDLLQIEVAKLSDQTESATLLNFAAKYSDCLMNCAIATQIPKVQMRCGTVEYPQFNAVTFKELGIRYKKFDY